LTVLFVSPHFDDVALSCLSHVLLAREQGRVVAATIFGRGQPGREAENAEAMGRLDVESVVLPFDDAPVRLGIVPSFASLLLDRHPHEAEDLVHVTAALAALQSEVQPARTFLPLAVGGHVDHRLAHACHRGLAGEICFYEDRPYADILGALRARLFEIGAVDAAAGLGPSPELAAVHASVFATFAPLLYPQPDRNASVERFTRRLLSSVTSSAPATIRQRLVPSELQASPLAGEIIGCYRSQLPDLFGDGEGLRRFLAARPMERIWRRAAR
jgi:LmbE family N-acetylglucosaminyl deacetylase